MEILLDSLAASLGKLLEGIASLIGIVLIGTPFAMYVMWKEDRQKLEELQKQQRQHEQTKQ